MPSKETNAHEMAGREQVMGLQRLGGLGERPESDTRKERIWGVC